MKKIASYDMPRTRAAILAAVVGIALGLLNAALGMSFIELEPGISYTGEEPGFFRKAVPFLILAGKVSAAIAATVVLHEGIHGAVAVLRGYKPRFGFKPPLVYVTFNEKVRRGAFILLAIAPLIVLDVVFGMLFYFNVAPVFSYSCIMVNTIGSIGDAWIVYKLLPHERGSLVRDTMTGIEVWSVEEAGFPPPQE